jgi:aromatic-L-amino-acid/L-tryptophan decarboxylase
MDPEEFRSAAHELVDWIADFRTRLPNLPVQTSAGPGQVRRALPATPPDGREPLASLLSDLDEVVVPGLTHVQHPRYFGWFPANASLASVLGDIASSGIGALGISWQSAPALTEVEEVVCDWMRQLAGLPDDWTGTIHDSASVACLVALLCAREQASGHSQERGGLQGEPAPLVVYTMDQAHSSVSKAALLAGFGRDNLRLVATDPRTHAMSADAFATAVDADVAAGRVPAAVVATIGTTGTTAVDPLSDIVDIARRPGAEMWVHVDAAMAGSALLLPECRPLFAGLDGADSMSWNPHKWIGTILDTSLYYTRRPDHLVRVMSTSPSYLRSAADGDVTQYRDWGIPLGRRFRALKLWFHLRIDGVDAIRDRMRRDIANAQWLADQVGSEPGWEVVAPVRLQTVCVRHRPSDADGEELDRHTLAWVDAVNSSGAALLTPSLLDGRWMVRVSIGAEATERADVELLWRLMQEAAGSERGR